MRDRSFVPLLPGGQLSASEHNRRSQAAAANARMTAPALSVGHAGRMLRTWQKKHTGRVVDGPDHNGAYSLVEIVEQVDPVTGHIAWRDKDGGWQGNPHNLPAFEYNGQTVAPGTHVRFWRSDYAEFLLFKYCCEAVGSGGSAASGESGESGHSAHSGHSADLYDDTIVCGTCHIPKLLYLTVSCPGKGPFLNPLCKVPITYKGNGVWQTDTATSHCPDSDPFTFASARLVCCVEGDVCPCGSSVPPGKICLEILGLFNTSSISFPCQMVSTFIDCSSPFFFSVDDPAFPANNCNCGSFPFGKLRFVITE